MFGADIGDDTYCGLYDRLQTCHLTHLRYTSLENCQFGLFVELPYRQWHANL